MLEIIMIREEVMYEAMAVMTNMKSYTVDCYYA